MADAPSGIGEALGKTPSHFVTSDHHDDSSEWGHDMGEEEDEGVKKQKLDGSLGDSLDDDSLLDDLKPAGLVVGGMGDSIVNSQGLGLGIAYFASTGNIKNPIYEGIPSLTPEWLLKKVWLKVNGDLEQSVLASLISKDMGPKLRQEIRTFLEKRGEIHTGNRINLKNTIMQAVEITIDCQKEKPTLTIMRDSNKRPKKDGKQEKNFSIGLTPYGHSICIAELQLKKRESYTQRTPTKLGLHVNLGMSLGDSVGGIPLSAVNVPVPPSSPSSSPSIANSGIALAGPGHPLAMNMGIWKPNVKEMTDELLKRNSQVGDLNGQLLKDEITMLKDECQKRDLIIAELKAIIHTLKPSYPLPPHLHSSPILLNQQQQQQQQQQPTTPTSSMNGISSMTNDAVVGALLDSSLSHHHPHPHSHSHSHLSHSHPSHPLSHHHALHPHHHHHHQIHLHSQQADHASHLLHIVDHPSLMGESMMAQADHQAYLPQ